MFAETNEIVVSPNDPANRKSNVRSRYLNTRDAAAYLGLSPRTLEKHRCYGTGPAYRKLGGRIVYAIEEMEAWAALGLRRSTSDPGKGIVYPAKRIIENDRRQCPYPINDANDFGPAPGAT